MRITGAGTFPISQMAKSYGARPPAAIASSDVTKPLGAIQPIRSDVFQSSSGVQQLVAAKVAQPVNFDAPMKSMAAARNAPAVFQMYRRAADKIEAAVAVQIGRTIDLQS